MRRPQAVIYLVVQAALAFTLVMLVQNVAMIFGLFAALVGVTVGMLGRTRWMLVAIVLEMGLSALCFRARRRLGFTGRVAAEHWPRRRVRDHLRDMYVRELEARGQAQTLAARTGSGAIANSPNMPRRWKTSRSPMNASAWRANCTTRWRKGWPGLVLQLEAIDSHLSRGNTVKAQAITQQAMERARSTLADARRAIDDLRSGDLPDIDLETAVRAEADRFTAASGIPCELSIVLPPALPEDVRECALRVVSEALTNIARYAQAQHAAVSLDDPIRIAADAGRDRSTSKCAMTAWASIRRRSARGITASSACGNARG